MLALSEVMTVYGGGRGTPCPAFGPTQDPGMLYPATGHQQALKMLDEGITANAPIMLLSGEAGAGKTLLLHAIEGRYLATRTIGWIRLNEIAIGASDQTAREAGAELSSDAFIASIEELLAEATEMGQPTLLIVDDAHLLAAEDLAELRQLQRLRHEGAPPLVLLLAADLPARSGARPRALSQDTSSTPIDLPPMDKDETAAYVTHRFVRMRCDCHRGISPFDAESLALLHRLSGGVPGVINQMVQRCLEDADRLGTPKITAALIERCLRQGPFRSPQIAPVDMRTTAAAIPFTGGAPKDAPDPTAPITEDPLAPVRADTDKGRLSGRIYALAGVAVIAAVSTALLWRSDPAVDAPALPQAAVEAAAAAPTVPTGRSEIPDSRSLLNEALEAGMSDPARAALLYERAAIWGNARAAYYLGQMFESGDGVDADTNRARAWYEAAGNIPGAAMRLAAIEAEPAPEAPAAPVAVAQTLLPDGQIELHWRSAPDNSPARFAIEYQDGEGQSQRVDTNRSAILLEGPVARWRLIALDAAGRDAGTTDWVIPAPPGG